MPDPAPPPFLSLVANPLRWQLLEALAAGDHTVSELRAIVGEPQNLVSYHLRQLRDGGLVTARRSSADGRDSYYSAVLTRIGAQLAAMGAALHPGLRLAPPAIGEPPSPSRSGSTRVLFLCTGNSARSQMAEALVRHRSSGRVGAWSAGSHPKPLHPLAVRTMQRTYGIDISANRSKHLDELRDERFDRVVTLCDKVREVCPELPGGPTALHWSLADPASAPAGARPSAAAFRATAEELDGRIGFLLAALAAPTN